MKPVAEMRTTPKALDSAATRMLAPMPRSRSHESEDGCRGPRHPGVHGDARSCRDLGSPARRRSRAELGGEHVGGDLLRRSAWACRRRCGRRRGRSRGRRDSPRSASCVTIAIDWPCSRLAVCSSASTSRLERESRLPVGSSANTRSGAVARARAIATRCCWPPESWCGRWLSRAERPSVCDEPVDAGALERGGTPAVEIEGQEDVRHRVERRHEVERLEDEADASPAKHREVEVAEARDLGVADPRPSAGGGVEARHDVHERRLARARRAHDRGELAAADADPHAVERPHLALSGAVGLGQLLDTGGKAQVGR